MTAEASTSQDPPPDTHAHRGVLLICAGIVLLSALLHLNAAGHVVLPGLEAFPLPMTCPTRVVLHIDCPGCGMTRSFIATAHGDFRPALAFNRLGPFLFAFVLLQLPFRLYLLARPLPPDRLPGRRLRSHLPWLFMSALLANWVFNLITGAAFH